MTEPVARLFEPLERAGDVLPVPGPGDVRARARQIRLRRSALVLSAVGLLLLGGVGGVRIMRGGGQGGGDVTPAGPFVTTKPSENNRHHGRSDDGFLTVEDLGYGSWSVDPGAEFSVTSFTPPRCRGAFPMTVAVSARQRIFAGITPEGASWRLVESVSTLVGDGPEILDAATNILSGGCGTPSSGGEPDTTVALSWTNGTQEEATVLARNGRMTIAGTLLPEGSVGHAQSFAVVGRTLVTIETYPGGQFETLRLPGQTDWLGEVTAEALERATGTVLPPPEPNQAARRAAAAPYVSPSWVDPPDDAVARPRPRPARRAPAGASAGTTTAGTTTAGTTTTGTTSRSPG